MKNIKHALGGISPRMRTVYVTLVVCILIVTAGALMTRRAARADASCNPLWTFNDGSRLWLCPPDIHPVDIAFKGATATQSPVPPKGTQRTASKVTATYTPVIMTSTITPTATVTVTATGTLTPTVTPTPSVSPVPSDTPTPGPSETPLPFPSTTPGAPIAPYPSAPLCPDWGDLHDTSQFHTIWDSVRGCHYDHEHGVNPFTPAVQAAFPGFDLQALGCGQQVNHCSPSSPIENTWDGKHGGFKWDVALQSFIGCTGFEGAPIGVNAAVVGYHNFGNYAIELNGRIHSALLLGRQCKAANPNDFGYVYIVQLVDYGQRTVPYQGNVMPYPDNPQPPYFEQSGPYVSFDCFGVKAPGELGACRTSLQDVLNNNRNANSIWTSKPTGQGGNSVHGSTLFNLLFRLRDTYQLIDWADQSYPFTFKYLCSTDGGNTYAPLPGCRYNNSTSKVHEIAGEIPAAWDNVVGLDTDSRVGRITADILVTRFGDLMPAGVCLQPGQTCFRVKLINAFVGRYASQLIDGKFGQFSVEGQPERDLYFCGQTVCVETSPGAVSSGWIGNGN